MRLYHDLGWYNTSSTAPLLILSLETMSLWLKCTYIEVFNIAVEIHAKYNCDYNHAGWRKCAQGWKHMNAVHCSYISF